MSLFAAVQDSNSGAGSLLIFALPVLLIGFMFITQRRRAKAVQSLQASLSVGDEISTTSGLLGRIVTLDNRIVTLEISPGVNVRLDRRAIAGPAPSASSGSASSTSATDTPSDPTSHTD